MAENQAELEVVKVKKVAGPIDGGAAVFLGNDRKTFVIFVGLYEANAIIKEIQEQKSIRPLTHDLMFNLMLGFEVGVKQVIISDIIDNTFCATLVLEQQIQNGGGEEWVPRRNEVRIDARASDSIVVALKAHKDILVSRQVFEQVEDVSDKLHWGESEEEADEEAEGEAEEENPFGNIDFGEFKLEEDEDD